MNRAQALAVLHLNPTDGIQIQKIKTAYFRQARLHHPDMGGELNQMQQINIAYSFLIKNLSNPSSTSESSAILDPEFSWHTDAVTLSSLNLFFAVYELSNIWLLAIKESWKLPDLVFYK